jgi:pilus assembly protein CpaB
MRMKSLVLIFIALGCGLVASIGISQVMERGGSAAPQMEMEQILVALVEVDAGAKLDPQKIRLEEWPKAKIPEGAVRSLDEVKDKFTLVRFYKGEPILQAKISDQAENITMLIPPGFRAMPVKIDDETVLKAVQVGDKVDVMVFLRRGDEIPETGSYPILKNVRIFAVGANTERTVDEKGKEVNARTVSLLVRPKQAQELAVASQMGKILLAVRPPNEVDVEGADDVIPIGDILSGKSSAASSADSHATPVAATPAPPTGLSNFLSDLTNNAATPTPAPAEPLAAAPKFIMHIFTPTEVRGYEWVDPNALPVESTLNTIGATAAPLVSPPPAVAIPAPPAGGPPVGGRL